MASHAQRGPDFIGIGTPKAATSWLFTCLGEHPDICAAEDKELDFFFEPNFSRGQEWYESRFTHCNGKIAGEFTPTYLHRKGVAERIHSLYPHAKLIAVLRNPVERFLSEFYFHYGLGRHDFTDPRDLPKEKYEKILKRGRYGEHLEHFYTLFPKEQVLVLIYEDIKKDPAAVMRQVFKFLGVQDSFVPPSLLTKENVTGNNRARSRSLKRAYYREFESISRSRHREKIFNILRTLGIGQFVKFVMRINNRPTSKVTPTEKKVDGELREKLYRSYEADIKKLEELLGKPLSWR